MISAVMRKRLISALSAHFECIAVLASALNFFTERRLLVPDFFREFGYFGSEFRNTFRNGKPDGFVIHAKIKMYAFIAYSGHIAPGNIRLKGTDFRRKIFLPPRR
jgi:hypothetical protein